MKTLLTGCDASDLQFHHLSSSSVIIARPVSASSNTLFKGLPSRLRPFDS
jgi:hypothetical protein